MRSGGFPDFNSTPLRQRDARRAAARVALSLRNIHCNAGIRSAFRIAHSDRAKEQIVRTLTCSLSMVPASPARSGHYFLDAGAFCEAITPAFTI